MALVISQPAGDQPCTPDGKVCVKGSGAIHNGVLATKVCAKIYQPPDGPSNPNAGPPSGAKCVTPNADGTWCIGLVGGADGSPQPPYPQNEAWVWAQYPQNSSSSSSSSSSSGGSIWQHTSDTFNGKEQSSVPTCC